MSSSNSSEMKDQIDMVFLGIMDEVMGIFQIKEVVTAVASSSTRWSKHHRCYVNRDREAAHFRVQHDYFDDDCVYPRHTSVGGIVCKTLFLSIMHKLIKIYLYFSEMYDATDRIGLTAL
jgi:hypothetical protein